MWVEAQLDFLYPEGESEAKIAHRKRAFNDDGTLNTFQRIGLQAAVRRKQEEDAVAPVVAPLAPVPEALVDDIPEATVGFDDRVDAVRLIKGQCGILTAVANWGKEQPSFRAGSRTESIMIRCPFPSHVDNKPSAWINTAKHLWHCGACQEGGDQIAFYSAAKYGITQQELHADKNQFQQVLREMADELGIDIDPPGPPVPPPPPPEPDEDPDAVQPMPEPEVPPAPDNAAPTEPPDPVLRVLEDEDFDPRDEDPIAWNGKIPYYDYQDLDLQEGTFLSDWILENIEEFYYVAPEYFIMEGLQGLGLACGHHLQPVTNRGRSNSSLMLVLVGDSGCGKNFAKDRLTQMFDDCDESRFDHVTATGIKHFPTPGSSEALLDALRYEMEDPTAVEKMIPLSVTALLVEDEFQQWVSKAARKGNEAVKSRLQILYDFYKRRGADDPELVAVDRARMTGVRELYDSYLSAVFLVQPQMLRSLITREDVYSGFMNRILPVYGRERTGDDTRISANLDRPGYYETWQRTWNRIRKHPVGTAVPWDSDVGQYLMSNVTWAEIGSIPASDGRPLLSRLKHHTCRLAFLFAVNEGRMTVGVKHFEIALRLVRDYIWPCYSTFFSAARATASQDLKTKLLEFLRSFYDRHGVWPTRRDVGKQRFWNVEADQVQKHTLENMISNQKIGFFFMKEGQRKTGTYVATDQDDHWGKHYSGCNGAVYTRVEVYGARLRASSTTPGG